MSEIVDAIMSKCKFGKKQNLYGKKESYHCSLTDIIVIKDNDKWKNQYNANCGITNEEAEELWYRIENRPLIKFRKDLLNWLGIKDA